MSIKSKLKMLFQTERNNLKQQKEMKTESAKYNFAAAELIRNTHSIEKGLCIESPRLGFGHNKQLEMLDLITTLSQMESTYYKEVCGMAMCALQEYIDYHEGKGYSDDVCDKIKEYLIKHCDLMPKEKLGGTVNLNRSEVQFNISEIEHFFVTRHSIRDFNEKEVDVNVLNKALKLAQKAPSACNRQGVRVYVIDNAKHLKFANSLAGIGGFAKSVNKFVIITGKFSSYRMDETNQYIVSASMYAAYLSLTLHLYGLGACVVQRPVVWSKDWDTVRRDFHIDMDEQIVCMLAVGNLKEHTLVPLSHRLEEDEMIHYI